MTYLYSQRPSSHRPGPLPARTRSRRARQALTAIPTSASAVPPQPGRSPHWPGPPAATAGARRPPPWRWPAPLPAPNTRPLPWPGVLYLAEPERRHALADALTAIRTYKTTSPTRPAQPLSGSPVPSPTCHPSCWPPPAARAIPAPGEQAGVLADLLPSCHPSCWLFARTWPAPSPTPTARVRALAGLARHLPATRPPPRPRRRPHRHPHHPLPLAPGPSLAMLAPLLPPELLATALRWPAPSPSPTARLKPSQAWPPCCHPDARHRPGGGPRHPPTPATRPWPWATWLPTWPTRAPPSGLPLHGSHRYPHQHQLH